MSKFGKCFLICAFIIVPTQLAAYVGLENRAIRGDVESVKSLVKLLNKKEKSDVERVEKTLEKVNDKIAAIYTQKWGTADKIQLAGNIGICALWTYNLISSVSSLKKMINKQTCMRQEWAELFSDQTAADNAGMAMFAAIGLMSSIFVVKHVDSLINSIDNPHKETIALLKKLLEIKEVLKTFLSSEQPNSL